MCTNINQLIGHVANIKDPTTRQQCFNILETMRKDIDSLRSWGHDLRKKLIELENTLTPKT